MTTQELRELDAWIAEHVMGWVGCRSGFQSKSDPENDAWLLPSKRYRTVLQCSWKPSTDSANSMDVLKKCAEKAQDVSLTLFPHICITKHSEGWQIGIVDWNGEELTDRAKAETLELCICKFAKQLFSQTTTK